MPRTTKTDENDPSRAARRGSRESQANAGGRSSAIAEREAEGQTPRSDAGPVTQPLAGPGGTPAGDARPSGAQGQDDSAASRAKSSPTSDDIARRAYELYQQRGGTQGQEVDDWLRAEAELREGRGRRDDEM